MSGDATSAVGCDSLTSINAVNCSASNATRQGMPHAPLLNIVHDVPRRVVFTRAALLADQRTGAHYDKRKVGDGDIVVDRPKRLAIPRVGGRATRWSKPDVMVAAVGATTDTVSTQTHTQTHTHAREHKRHVRHIVHAHPRELLVKYALKARHVVTMACVIEQSPCVHPTL